MRFRCASCSRTVESDDPAPQCYSCGSPALIFEEGAPRVSRVTLEDLPQGVWRYRDLLPPVDGEVPVTLGEGGTPLLHAERLGRELGLRELWIKDESRNPTGSFMDRGSTVLLTLAKTRGIKYCACVTTGNLGASVSAYCAKAGIEARIQINPNIDQGKLYQMLAYGAKVGTKSHHSGEKNSIEVTAANPYLLEGEKTTGFEIVQEFGWKAPDVIVVPVGTGGHISMIWRAILETSEAGLSEKPSCRLFGVKLGGIGGRQSHGRGSSPRYGFPLAELSESEPFFRSQAESAIADSHGQSVSTAPEESIAAMDLLAKAEGIFAEPSAASVIAALATAVRGGKIDRDESVVCVITGSGLKDTESVSRTVKATRRSARPNPYMLPSSRLGETKLALLRSLKRRPSYGYELRQIIRRDREISTASVYQHLSELERFDLIRKRGSMVSGGRERIVYEITRRGVGFLDMAAKLEKTGGE